MRHCIRSIERGASRVGLVRVRLRELLLAPPLLRQSDVNPTEPSASCVLACYMLSARWCVARIRCTKSSFQNRLFRPKFSTLSFSSFLSLSLPHTSNLRSGLPSVTLETIWARCLVFRMSYLVSKVRYMRRQISDLTQICFSLDVVMCV